MTRQPFRAPAGGRVDRTSPLAFRFDGRAYEGYEGDTLASALLANGVRVVGRSFRLHRTRGIMGAGAEEPSAIMQLGAGAGAEPNVKATQVQLFDGLEARAVNAWPSARFDVGALIGLAAGVLPAGFYYKTFMRPSWGWFAPLIRQLGGLGASPRAADPDRYAKTFAACDVLVIGAGPAGLAAALAAGRSGARVMLVDDKPELGGSLLEQGQEVGGKPGLEWVAEAERELAGLPEVRILRRTTATGWYDHNLLTVVQECGGDGPRQRFWKLRARRVVLGAGAFERPLVFPGNDRPGVMLLSAARAYARRFGVLAGRRAAIVTNNDSAYSAALDLIEAGMALAAIVDLRPAPTGAEVERLQALGVPLIAGHAPVATHGRSSVRALTLAPIDAAGRAGASGIRIACDLVAVAGGWNPTVHLHSQAGGRLLWDEAQARFAPAPGEVIDAETIGAAAGEMTLSGALRQGAGAGARAARACGFVADALAPATAEAPDPLPIRQIWEVQDAPGLAWVDFQNDVTSADVRLAARENYVSVEHLKRYTTLGMALDQGKTSNVNGIGVLSQALAAPVTSIGTTKFRPPFSPVRFGAIAGRRLGLSFHALMRLPTHARQLELGAAMDEYAGWARPACYPAPGEDEEAAVRREALAVRAAAGLFEASSLGKILVSGPDAAAFLQRIYVNPMSTLPVGRCRYGLMLDEQGAVMDDGVAARLGPEDFLLSTSSGHAAKVADWLDEWLQCEWPDLEVVVQPVTSAWATLTVAGPQSRRILSALAPGFDLSDASLPHMALVETRLGDAPCRIARVSFTGERSYEVSVPASRGTALWDAIQEAGAPVGLSSVGVEAVMRLRLEKGYLHVGADTDATTYPHDLGYAAPAAKTARDYIGRRSTLRAGDGPRRQLVGIQPLDAAAEIPIGSHLGSPGAPARSEGWVTSSGFSPTLSRWVGLAMVENGLSRVGEELVLHDLGRRVRVRLSPTCAYDPEGVRLHA